MADGYDNWRDERPDERFERRGPRRGEPRFEQRLDQWVSAGRQFVDGVSGARPGSRPGGRGTGLKLDHLGRWVEDKLDWLLEDDDGWRESWEAPASAPAELTSPQPKRRKPLVAISRRGRETSTAPLDSAPAAADQDWPDDDSFTLNRWQRGGEAQRPAAAPDAAVAPQMGRTLPRSTRRRLD